MNLLRHLLPLTLMLWLSACGPGVGGSGTGQPMLAVADFGAVPTPVCGATFASRLNCSPAAGGVAAPAGTAAVTFVDVGTGGQISATLRANGIELEARCQRLSFSGEWAVIGANDARFFGIATDERTGLSQLASLSVAEIPGGLQVLLRAFDGSVILGPVEMQPATAAAEPALACP